MSRFATKTLLKIMTSLMIFFVFAYLVVIICSIPRDFTIVNSNGKIISTYSLQDILKKANGNIAYIAEGKFSEGLKNKNQAEIFADKIQKTMVLLLSGIALGIVLGILKGIFDSRKGTRKDSNLKVLLTILPISFPDLLIIVALQMLAIWLINHGITIFKVAGEGTINHILLPILALSILPASYIARVTAVSIESCYEMEYVKIARGKGCSNRRILWNHVMRNALGIISEGLSNITSLIICNLLIVEFMFSYMGLGTALVQFYRSNDRVGFISVILILGVIYFVLDNLFQLLRRVTFKPLKEESV